MTSMLENLPPVLFQEVASKLKIRSLEVYCGSSRDILRKCQDDTLFYSLLKRDFPQYQVIKGQGNYRFQYYQQLDTLLQWNYLASLSEEEYGLKNATRDGILPLVELFVDRGYLLIPKLCKIAAKEGHLNILMFLHEHDCPWNGSTCAGAALMGHLDCLKYAHTEGCPWNEFTCSEAAREGHLDCLEYAHEQGCPWDEFTCSDATRGGYLECLKYAHQQGCPWDSNTCANAALGGYLNILKYAHTEGCPWDRHTCSDAAHGGYLNCLKYAHEEGCLWDKYICSEAATGGHLDCLKYAHEQGCHWDKYATLGAIRNSRLDCLEYIVNQGGPRPSRGNIESELRDASDPKVHPNPDLLTISKIRQYLISVGWISK